MNLAYQQAKSLLQKAQSPNGFLAAINDVANYKRIWARDGVICGLAGLLDGDKTLVKTMKATLETLAKHQHEIGNIPSNVDVETGEVSFGGLAGRVDTLAWFVIGVCQYAHVTEDTTFFKTHKIAIDKCLKLMQAWEFNNGDLMYVPRSGNWADEYPTEGFILYDQLLRLWAIRCVLHFEDDQKLQTKYNAIQNKIELNYKKRDHAENVYHPNAYNQQLDKMDYWVASLEPAGYQTQFDAFANSLVLILDIGQTQDQNKLLNYCKTLKQDLSLKSLPAFWPVITKDDKDWDLLTNNCKYEFRNYPYQFHNGGTWPMVNGFYGIGCYLQGEKKEAEAVLEQINTLNAKANWGFYENFDSKTQEPNGVKYCTWSAAATMMLTQFLNGKQWIGLKNL
ncbi:glycoside hydrolase 100 family protein [Flavobacteriaceae bacterium 14752]|uniref:glycoside hydrolase 100 family protein n=1 Tax=Mesohalobacter salilacus TaxID=2491711 RepID=UPI000F63F3D1|nr:fructofuranosidase/invertase [Flavobacteriaceae bacterium 14752]